MKKTVPSVTRPWREKVVRRHVPPPARGAEGFQSYRPCLRWEFGFSCAFCLCHETDLMLATEGWAVMQIEHFVPKTHDPSLINVYTNCFYICRLCNNARGSAPNRSPEGGDLLNPCDTVWHERFQVLGDELQPRDGADGDAVYTSNVYDFGDPRKTGLRRLRRRLISQRLRFLRRTRDTEDKLLDRVEGGGDRKHLLELVDLAREIRKERTLAFDELLRYEAVPRDRDSACRCGHDHHHTLPRVLEDQMPDLAKLRPRSRARSPRVSSKRGVS